MKTKGKLKKGPRGGIIITIVLMTLPAWLLEIGPLLRRIFAGRDDFAVYLQKFDELPLKDMFVIFLTMFVLMGLVPFFEKIVSRLHEHYRSRSRNEIADHPQTQKDLEAYYVEPEAEIELYDFEVIILRLLAVAGWKGLSLQVIASELHLEPDFVRKTLSSLNKSGLVTFMEIPVLGRYYFLSRAGRRYSERQGFLFSM